MKSKYLALLLVISQACFSQETFHNFQALTIDSNMVNLSQYYGKKVMVVNTASYCVYTPQYADLQQLYQLYQQYNFEILGFPCNDFGSQEPGNESAIDSFCSTYGVTFQMMSKVDIISTDTAEVYKWLQLASRNGVANASVTWNFHKFLIDETGHWVAHYPSQVNPLATVITDWIMTPSTVGINEHTAISSVNLSGNPATAFINLNIVPNASSLVAVKLFFADGRLAGNLFEGTITGQTEFNFETRHFQNGIYFLNISSGTDSKVLKVVLAK